MIQQETGVLDLLRPLLLDSDPSVQQNAALALGRLANYNPQLAEKIVASDIVPQLVASILKNNVCFHELFKIIVVLILFRNTIKDMQLSFCELSPSTDQD